ncbi:hypothetical protein HDU89_001060 [Geranomyces variabilis]|nr:hypothetical protein HDU89_001060 [Geranomyces variabilis]
MALLGSEDGPTEKRGLVDTKPVDTLANKSTVRLAEGAKALLSAALIEDTVVEVLARTSVVNDLTTITEPADVYAETGVAAKAEADPAGRRLESLIDGSVEAIVNGLAELAENQIVDATGVLVEVAPKPAVAEVVTEIADDERSRLLAKDEENVVNNGMGVEVAMNSVLVEATGLSGIAVKTEAVDTLTGIRVLAKEEAGLVM